MIRFIHAADIHLDSPLKGLEKYEGAPPVEAIRGAARRALENLVKVAIERRVDFVLIAGDVYDGDWKDHNTGLFFVTQMNRLREAGIPVVMISGNHDAANKMTKNLRLPDNVERLPHAQPATARNPKLAELGVAVHGQSFGERAESSNLVDGYPTKAAGLFNIGLLHTSLEGGEGHVAYAPCSLDDLKRKEYDYWALGHVHTRAVRCEAPYVVYPGNIQGRHIRETGSKGCYLVGLDDRGRCELEFVPLDVLRWEVCELDATPHSRPDDLCEAFAGWLQSKRQVHGGLPLCVRLVVTGASAVHGVLHADATRWTNEIRSVAAASSECPVWVEKVAWRTSAGHSRIDAEDTSGPMGLLSDYVAELLNDDVELKALAGGLADLRRKLPEALTVGDDALLMDGPDQMRQWIKQIEPLLLDRLREGSDA